MTTPAGRAARPGWNGLYGGPRAPRAMLPGLAGYCHDTNSQGSGGLVVGDWD
uniref:Uncharacterized protein n=1 Tax=Arundo donax TaxID=35708 RepID=A0A0A9TTV0_ARUDO